MIDYKLLTSQGDRENNEDCIGMLEKEDEYCFVLADGLGGHGYGEKASETAVKSILEYFYEFGLEQENMSKAIDNAQKEIRRIQKENPMYRDMKTTLVVLHILKDKIRYAHVGDSRLYYFEKGKIVKRTLDHSVPQNMVLSGEIKEKEIRHHSDRNRLLRVMGTEWDSPQYEISDYIEISQKKQQAFLLCTDGFWELIVEKDMCKLLKKTDSCKTWSDDMEEIVKTNGQGTNMDNYSAITVIIP